MSVAGYYDLFEAKYIRFEQNVAFLSLSMQVVFFQTESRTEKWYFVRTSAVFHYYPPPPPPRPPLDLPFSALVSNHPGMIRVLVASSAS